MLSSVDISNSTGTHQLASYILSLLISFSHETLHKSYRKFTFDQIRRIDQYEFYKQQAIRLKFLFSRKHSNETHVTSKNWGEVSQLPTFVSQIHSRHWNAFSFSHDALPVALPSTNRTQALKYRLIDKESCRSQVASAGRFHRWKENISKIRIIVSPSSSDYQHPPIETPRTVRKPTSIPFERVPLPATEILLLLFFLNVALLWAKKPNSRISIFSSKFVNIYQLCERCYKQKSTNSSKFSLN